MREAVKFQQKFEERSLIWGLARRRRSSNNDTAESGFSASRSVAHYAAEDRSDNDYFDPPPLLLQRSDSADLPSTPEVLGLAS